MTTTTTIYLCGTGVLDFESPALDRDKIDGKHTVLAITGHVTLLMALLTEKRHINASYGLTCRWHAGFVQSVRDMTFRTLNAACASVLRPTRKPTVNVYVNLLIHPRASGTIEELRAHGHLGADEMPMVAPRDEDWPVSIRKRYKEKIQDIEKEIGPISRRQRRRVEEHIYFEHKQEEACAAYIGERSTRQQRLKQGNFYVVADAFDSERPNKSLVDETDVRGVAWEVKSCDGIHLLQHAHGQSDFQRIFGEKQRSSLWLYTEDPERGARYFQMFCDCVVPISLVRYDEIVLARAIKTESESVSGARARNAILRRWYMGSVEVMEQRDEDELIGLPPLRSVPCQAHTAACED